MVEHFNVGLYKEARLGSMVKNPKLGLGSGSTLEARARLGLEKIGLIPPLRHTPARVAGNSGKCSVNLGNRCVKIVVSLRSVQVEQ